MSAIFGNLSLWYFIHLQYILSAFISDFYITAYFCCLYQYFLKKKKKKNLNHSVLFCFSRCSKIRTIIMPEVLYCLRPSIDLISDSNKISLAVINLQKVTFVDNK